MANARKANVLVVDTTATFDEKLHIRAIKYIGASTSSVTISTESTTIWEEDGTTDKFEEVCIWAAAGITVTVTGTAKAYIYLKT